MYNTLLMQGNYVSKHTPLIPPPHICLMAEMVHVWTKFDELSPKKIPWNSSQ